MFVVLFFFPKCPSSNIGTGDIESTYNSRLILEYTRVSEIQNTGYSENVNDWNFQLQNNNSSIVYG